MGSLRGEPDPGLCLHVQRRESQPQLPTACLPAQRPQLPRPHLCLPLPGSLAWWWWWGASQGVTCPRAQRLRCQALPLDLASSCSGPEQA